MLQFLLILESPLWVALEQCLVMISWLGGWGWGLCLCVLVSGGGSCLSEGPKCPVVSFGVSIGSVWLWATYLLMCSILFLFS